MTVPANRTEAERVYDHLKRDVVATTNSLSSARQDMAAGNIDIFRLRKIHNTAVRWIEDYDRNKATQGLVDQAKKVEADTGLDVVAEYQEMRKRLVSLRDALRAVKVPEYSPEQTASVQSLIQGIENQVSR